MDDIIQVNLRCFRLLTVSSGSRIILIDDLINHPTRVLERRRLDDNTVAAVNPKTDKVIAQGNDVKCIVVEVP